MDYGNPKKKNPSTHKKKEKKGGVQSGEYCSVKVIIDSNNNNCVTDVLTSILMCTTKCGLEV